MAKRACIWCAKELEVEYSITTLFSFKKLTNEKVCKKCLHSFLPISTTSACRGCCKPNNQNEYCIDCVQWKKEYPFIDLRHEALYSYDSFAKEWMETFKFKGDIRLAEMVGIPVKEKCAPFQKTHLIVPAPSSLLSMEERGFNQVEVILDYAQVKYQSILMNKSVEMKQSSKTKEERLKMEQPFYIKEEYGTFLKGKNILLIDDVYTTGRTMYHAADCLWQGGAKSVSSVSLFR